MLWIYLIVWVIGKQLFEENNPPPSFSTLFHGILELWKSGPKIKEREEVNFRKRGAA